MLTVSMATRRERQAAIKVEETHKAVSRDCTDSWWSWRYVPELLAIFLLFAGLAHFLYLGPAGKAFEDIGVPGHDSFYHVKMAVLMPEMAGAETFPWLTTTVFAENFVNHHYGFQLLLAPFVRLAHHLTGDYAAGARWFMTLSFGLSMALFHLLLMVRRIEHRWIWLVLCLLLPSQFFTRHLFVRAISPSLICMLMLCLCMFRRKYVAAGIVVFLSIHIYLGAVVYAPILVIAVFAAEVVGRFGERIDVGPSAKGLADAFPALNLQKLVGWTLAGWAAGLLTHPSGAIDVLAFLKLQMFGSGLTPDIPVGREWKSYSPAWFFASMSGVTLTTIAAALCLRLRFGGRIGTDTLALLLMNFVFFALTLRARRFIEYWPMFALLSAAYLAGPLFGKAQPRSIDACGLKTPRRAWGWAIATLFFLTGVWIAAAQFAAVFLTPSFLSEWRLWATLATLCLIVPLSRAWADSPRPRVYRVIGATASGGVFYALVGALMRLLADGRELPAPRMNIGWPHVVAVLVALAVCATEGLRTARGRMRDTSPAGLRRSLGVLTLALVVLGVVVVPAGAMFGHLQNKTKSLYDLAPLRAVMAVLETRSRAGAIVFTDDWDIFPVYFYLNHRNHYVTGLDPKFSHEKDPVLWERYVRITRGQTPTTRTVNVISDGTVKRTKIDISLRDIRDHFGAEFVIVDRDHRPLARKLDRASDFARRIFPESVNDNSPPPYLLYEILPIDDARSAPN